MGRAWLVLAIVVGLVASGRAEQNQCVTCHENEKLPLTLGHSFADWRASVHGHGGVGCEKCHGGDPSAATAAAAHVGVASASDPQSLVAPGRLPGTCGACHAKELAAYADTVHARELKKSHTGATCFTCHGAMATSLPTPRELAERCAVCHKRPTEAEAALIVLVSAKSQLYRTRRAMDAAKAVNPSWHENALPRFHDLEHDYQAIQMRWHTFAMRKVLQDSRDLLKIAQGLAAEADVMARRGSEK